MLSVEDAQDRILAHAPLVGSELVPLGCAMGRVLAQDITASRDQPPFAASAMDGYAVRWADIATLPATFAVTGESAAGKRAAVACTPGTAVRIFTGAPMPEGADTVVVQEDCTPLAGGQVVVTGRPGAAGGNVRPAGIDFRCHDRLLAHGRRLTDRDVALIAASGEPLAPVARQPHVAILASGDELRLPGEPLGPDDIVATNSLALTLALRTAGARVTDLGIVPDDRDKLVDALRQAQSADLVITIGGASVGDKDLTQSALLACDAHVAFWKIAMRPGKPMLFAEMGLPDRRVPVLGLPGNPVSSLVCGRLFVLPLVRRMQGEDDARCLPTVLTGRLAVDAPANGDRTHYMRAHVHDSEGETWVTPLPSQDSSLLSALASANALAIRPPGAAAASLGERIDYILL